MQNSNNSPHWTESDLIDRLYGLDPAAGQSERHLDECAQCGQAFAELSSRRGQVIAAQAQVSNDQLRAQRQAIWARIEQPQRSAIWRAVPVAATAMLLFVAVALHQAPAPQMEPMTTAAVQPAVSDTQLFTELASVVNQESPRAADPIRGLFADDATVEAQ